MAAAGNPRAAARCAVSPPLTTSAPVSASIVVLAATQALEHVLCAPCLDFVSTHLAFELESDREDLRRRLAETVERSNEERLLFPLAVLSVRKDPA